MVFIYRDSFGGLFKLASLYQCIACSSGMDGVDEWNCRSRTLCDGNVEVTIGGFNRNITSIVGSVNST